MGTVAFLLMSMVEVLSVLLVVLISIFTKPSGLILA